MPTNAPSVIVDLATGQTTTHPLTPDEQAAWDALQAQTVIDVAAAAEARTIYLGAYDTPNTALQAFKAAVVTDTAALGSGRAGVAALVPASVTNIATAVTYLTAERTALLAEIDALHATLADVRNALEKLADVVATLKARNI